MKCQYKFLLYLCKRDRCSRIVLPSPSPPQALTTSTTIRKKNMLLELKLKNEHFTAFITPINLGIHYPLKYQFTTKNLNQNFVN